MEEQSTAEVVQAPAEAEQAEVSEEQAPGAEAAPAAEAEAEAPPERGWSDTLAYLEKVDPDAYKHARNMRADYTRKTQALAAQRKEIEAQADLLKQQELRIQQMMSALTGSDPDDLPEYDPFQPESVIAHTRQRIYEEHIKPLQQQAAEEQARLDLAKVQREHPDIFDEPEVKAELVAFLKERPTYKLTDGIEVIRARLAQREAQAQAERRAAQRTASRTAALTATAGARRNSGRLAKPSRKELRTMTAADILALSKELDRQR